MMILKKGMIVAYVRSWVVAVALCFGALHAGALTIESNTQLQEDTDWTGQGAVTIAAGATLDLNGHKLSVDGLAGAGTITDLTPLGEDTIGNGDFTATNMAGELHVVVPNGQTTENKTVAITGLVRVVKEGAGTFVAAKKNQSYTGGTEVAAGTFRCGAAGSDHIYGADKSTVTVREGAVFDCDGYCNHNLYHFVLDGGTMTSLKDDRYPGWLVNWFTDVELTKNSFWSGSNYGFGDAKSGLCKLQMNGHVLTVDMTDSGEFYACNLMVEGGGEIYMRTGGWLALGGSRNGKGVISGTAVKAETTKLHMGNAAVDDLGGEHVFGSYVSDGESEYDRANTVIKVKESFKPGMRWHATELQDGATLDLSDCAGVWNTTCEFMGSGTTATATFSAGATIVIDLGKREPAGGMKLVGWTDADAPLPTAQFKLSDEIDPDNFMLDRRSDGLYIMAAVKTADWTGAADNVCTNPANWICKDANGSVIDGARPGSITAVNLSGAVQLDIPADSGFSCASFTCDNASLKVDCDWSGLGQQMNGSIDLAGHKLTVGSLTGNATITSSTASGYEILEYIDSDGKAYIETGVPVVSNTVIDIKMRLLQELGAKTFVSYVGARVKYATSGAFGGWFYGMNHYRDQDSPTTTPGNFATAALNTDYLVHLDKNGPCTVNGGEPFAIGSGVGNDLPIMVFCINQSGVPSYPGKFRVYSCTIKYGNVVQCDLKPARRLSDGALGLLDVKNLENLEFHENKDSSGAFTAGSVVSDEFVKQTAELHVVVPNGQTTENKTVAIMGLVRVVKEGPGTFVATMQNQVYRGGTEVAAGTFRCGAAANGYIYGAKGSTVTVREGAVFDCDGYCNHNLSHFVLDGGTMTSLKDDRYPGWLVNWFTDVELTKDSFWSGSNYGFVDAKSGLCKLQMNGHVLTVDMTDSGEFYACNLMVEGGGEIYMRTGGWLALGGSRNGKGVISGTAVKAGTTKLHMGNAAVDDLGGEHVFGSYVSDGESEYDRANTVIKVQDLFIPGTKWHATELQDGATLDLSAYTDAWNTTCEFTGSGTTATATFAEGATIIVDVGDRKVKSSEPIVTWSAKPEKVKFCGTPGAVGTFEAREDGLYRHVGFSIIIR